MEHKNQIRSVLIGMAVVLASGAGIYFFISALIDKLASIDSDTSKALIGAGVTVFAATLTIVGGKLLEQKIKIKQEVRSKKVPIYEEQMEVIFKILLASKKGNKNIKENEMIKAFTKFTEKLIIWGGSEVIKTWEEFRLHPWEGADNNTAIEGFMKFEKFVFALRKDLGNENSNLEDGDLLKMFINDFDEYAQSGNAKKDS